MGGVDLTEVVGQPANELVAGEARQAMFGAKVGEDLIKVGTNVAPVAERRGARDVHCAEVTGPRIHVAEQVPVERLEVRHVVVARKRMQLEELSASEGEIGLGSLQLRGVIQPEEVDERAGVGIDVRVVAHRLWRASVRATSSSAASSPDATRRASWTTSGLGSRPSSRAEASASSTASSALTGGAAGVDGRADTSTIVPACLVCSGATADHLHTMLTPFRVPLRHQVVVGWVGLRGATPIILATFPLVERLPEAQLIFDAVFFVVLTSILVQGTTVGLVAKLLGVTVPVRERVPAPLEAGQPLADGTAMREVTVLAGSFGDGRTLVELHLPSRALVVLIERDHTYIVPTGATRLSPGDHVLVLADDDAFAAARDRLEAPEPDEAQPAAPSP